MDHETALQRILPLLPPRKRAAFAGACAERARALFEATSEDDPEWFFDALGFVWDFAEGKDPAREKVDEMEDRVQAVYDQLAEDEDTYRAAAVRSLLGALGSIHDPSTESAEVAAQFAVDAASGTTFEDEHVELAEQEEEKFQLAVLDIVQSWAGETIRLRAFKPIGWTDDDGWPEAKWLERLENDPSW